jgi:hypothetical protein
MVFVFFVVFSSAFVRTTKWHGHLAHDSRDRSPCHIAEKFFCAGDATPAQTKKMQASRLRYRR